MALQALELALIAAGAFFLLVASLGLWRLGDFYQRLHAPTKAATLGLLSLFAAAALELEGTDVLTKALLAMVFIGATAPIGAHYLSRAAYRSGVRPKEPMSHDAYAAYVRAERREERESP